MTKLLKRLTLFDLSMIAVGSMIGSGIFLSPAIVMKNAGHPTLVLLLWAVGGVYALSGALSYSELGAMMPGAGGIYVYLSRIFGPWAGFLYGWIYLTVINSGSIAALAVAFATYFGYFVPLSQGGMQAAAIGGIAVLTLINMRSVKAGALFSDLFTVLKILGILGLIAIGLGMGKAGNPEWGFNFGDTGDLGGTVAVAMVAVFWSFGGWHHTTFLAGEAKRPQKDIPKAMIIGAGSVALIYILTNLAYFYLLSPPEIASSSSLAAQAVETVLGPVGGSLIALVIFISTFGTAGIYTMAAPRIYFAMASDGIFFKKVAQVHPRFHTPLFAILFQSVWASLLILFWGTFENLISNVVFTDALFFGLTAVGVIVLRRRQPHAERQFKVPGYPVTPLIFIGISAWLVVSTLIAKPLQSLAGLGFVLLGFPVYWMWRRGVSPQSKKDVLRG